MRLFIKIDEKIAFKSAPKSNGNSMCVRSSVFVCIWNITYGTLIFYSHFYCQSHSLTLTHFHLRTKWKSLLSQPTVLHVCFLFLPTPLFHIIVPFTVCTTMLLQYIYPTYVYKVIFLGIQIPTEHKFLMFNRRDCCQVNCKCTNNRINELQQEYSPRFNAIKWILYFPKKNYLVYRVRKHASSVPCLIAPMFLCVHRFR